MQNTTYGAVLATEEVEERLCQHLHFTHECQLDKTPVAPRRRAARAKTPYPLEKVWFGLGAVAQQLPTPNARLLPATHVVPSLRDAWSQQCEQNVCHSSLPGHQDHITLRPDSSLQWLILAEFKAICSQSNQKFLKATDLAAALKRSQAGFRINQQLMQSWPETTSV